MSDDFTGADIAAGMSGGGDPAPITPDSAGAPTSIETPDPSAAATTVPPATSQQPPAKPQGPIPFEDHKRIIENARTKAAEEYRAKYGWAESIPQTEFQQVQALAKRLSGPDPVSALQELITEVTANPTHAQAVRSLIAKSLASGRPAATMPDPDVDITDAAGNVIGSTYSAKGMAARDAFIVQQVLAKVDEKYAPVVKTHEEVAAERELLKAQAAASKWNDGFKSELETYPGFKDKDNQLAMGQDVLRQLSQYAKDDPRTDDPAFLEALTLRAYNRVVVPKLGAAAQHAAAQTQIAKASGSGVVPGRAPVGAPKRGDDGRFTADEIRDAFNQRKLG